jgi:hypothetical protein
MSTATVYTRIRALLGRIWNHDPGALEILRAAAAANGRTGGGQFGSDVAQTARLAGWAEAAIVCLPGSDMAGCGSLMAEPDVLVCEWRRGDRDTTNESVYLAANCRGHLWRWMRQRRLIYRGGDDPLLGALALPADPTEPVVDRRLAAAGRAFRRQGIDAGGFYSPANACQTDYNPRTLVAIAVAASPRHTWLRAGAELRPRHERCREMVFFGPTPEVSSADVAEYQLGRRRTAARVVVRLCRHRLSLDLLYRIMTEEPGWIRAVARARPAVDAAVTAIGRTTSSDVVRVLAARVQFLAARVQFPTSMYVQEGRAAILRMAARVDGPGSLRAAFAPEPVPALSPMLHWADLPMIEALDRITLLPPGQWPFYDIPWLARACNDAAEIIRRHWTNQTVVLGELEERRQTFLRVAARLRSTIGDGTREDAAVDQPAE